MTTPVIGLDRDGTINEDIGLTQEGVPPYCIKPDQFKPIPGSLEAVKMIRDKGYDVVILTNQSGIQRGVMDAVDVDIVNNYMLELLAEVGCQSINGLYYSTTPFKDDPYRKPNPGMILKAIKKWNLRINDSFFIGDSISDYNAAKKIGLRFYYKDNGLFDKQIKRIVDK